MPLQETPEQLAGIYKRFWPKVTKLDDDSCWPWIGGKVGVGYGGFFFRGRIQTAHRVSWMLANLTEIPDGMVVMHSCDNPPCVNPAHLSVGTVPDNIADKCAKGRQRSGDNHPARLHPGYLPRGDSHHFSKLTSEKVLAIREQAKTTKGVKLAAAFNVSHALISLIIHRRVWAHI